MTEAICLLIGRSASVSRVHPFAKRSETIVRADLTTQRDHLFYPHKQSIRTNGGCNEHGMGESILGQDCCEWTSIPNFLQWWAA